MKQLESRAADMETVGYLGAECCALRQHQVTDCPLQHATLLLCCFVLSTAGGASTQIASKYI